MIFTSLGLGVSQYVTNSFDYGSAVFKSKALIVVALSLLFIVLKPLVAIVSLPSRGVFFTVLTASMSIIIIYILTLFIPTFRIHSSQVENMIIFGVSIPGFNLTSFQSMVFSGLIICLVYSFLEGLCKK